MLRIALLLGMMLGLSLFSSAQSAKVIAENVNLRGTPTITGRVIDTVPWNTTVEILRQKGGWFLIQTDEIVGWVYGDGLRITGRSTGYYGTPSTIGSAGPARPSAAASGNTPSSKTTIVVPVVVVENTAPKAPSQGTTAAPGNSEPSVGKSQDERVAEKPDERLSTGTCQDGTLTYSAEKQGACADHGGIADWYADKEPAYTPPAGGPVQVKGYYRKDGTYVRPHTRSRPRN